MACLWYLFVAELVWLAFEDELVHGFCASLLRKHPNKSIRLWVKFERIFNV